MKKRCYEDGAFLQFCTPEQQDNITIAITAVCNRGSALKHCSERLRDDVRLVKLALKFGSDFHFIAIFLFFYFAECSYYQLLDTLFLYMIRRDQHWVCVCTLTTGPRADRPRTGSPTVLFHEMGSCTGTTYCINSMNPYTPTLNTTALCSWLPRCTVKTSLHSNQLKSHCVEMSMSFEWWCRRMD